MMMIRTIAILQMSLLASGSASVAVAALPPGFSPSAVSESFENLNRPDSPNAIDNLPTPFTFPSGLSIVSPAPNAVDSTGVFVVEGGFFGFAPGPNGQGIPDGEAYLGQGNPGLADPVRLLFPQTVAKIGAYVAVKDDNGGSVIVEALNDQNGVLASTVVTGIGPAEWLQNFIMLSSPGIASMRFTGNGVGVLRVDLVAWETVPEPSSVALASVASVVGASMRRRARQRR